MKRAKKGSGSFRRYGDVWYIRYWVDGKQHEESSGSARLSDAQKVLREHLASAGVGPPRRTGEILVSELLDDLEADYQMRRRRSLDDFLRWKLRKVRPYWGARRTSEVTTPALLEYRHHRQADGAADATINRELSVLRRAFNLAARATPPKVTAVPYFPMATERNVRTGFLEPEDYRRLLAELPHEIQPLLVVAYHVGCRRGELVGVRGKTQPLAWSQVDLLHDQIVLRPGTTKNDEGRVLPIYGEMKSWLVMIRAERDAYFPTCPWVFHRDGEPIKNFRPGWDAACARAGLAGLRFHDLRRSAVRNMERAGVPRHIAMAISGHKTESVYRRYDIVADRDLREAGAKLAAYLDSRRAQPGSAAPPRAETQERVQ
jgi:integrase